MKKNHYKCIVVDPPWNQGRMGNLKARPNKRLSLDYRTMTLDEIAAVPVREWAADNAFLWLWATNSYCKSARRPILTMAFELLERWDFKYYTLLTWDKGTGPVPFGPYQITTEHLLFGYRGKFSVSRHAMGRMKTCFQHPPGRHSEKPAGFYRHIVECFDGPRLDVFARERHPHFDAWGDEAKSEVGDRQIQMDTVRDVCSQCGDAQCDCLERIEAEYR